VSIPLISVVTPTYNRGGYLQRSLDSVLDQNFADMELILVDDGSNDNTPQIAAGITDTRFHYVRRAHSGAPASRNACIENAQGKYLLWLDSDDELIAGTLEHYANEINTHPKIDILYGDLQLRDNSGNNSILAFDNYHHTDNLLAKLIRGTIIPNPGTLVRKSLYNEHGNYDVRFRRAHDFEFWSRALENARIKHSGVTCCRYRWHSGNMSSGTTDLSFEAGVIKLLCQRTALKVLFPELDWSDSLSSLRAWEIVANLLTSCNDHKNAIIALQNGLSSLPANTSTIAKKSYIKMLNNQINKLNDMAQHSNLDGELTIDLYTLSNCFNSQIGHSVKANTN